MTTIQDLEGLFDDHPSLDASLADFEPGSSELAPSPRFPNHAIGLYPSHHSGFRSDSEPESDRDDNQSLSGGGYSPPAWRRAKNGTRSSGFWDRGDMVMSRGMKSARNSRESSPEYESADDGEGDATLAAAQRTRLPTGSLSPEKGRSLSPDPYPTGGGDFGQTFGADATVKKEEEDEWRATRSPEVQENGNNYIRFAMRAEVQHRTEPFEAAFCWARSKVNLVMHSWLSFFTSVMIAFISVTLFRMLFSPSAPQPVPDLVKVAGLAKAFEPLIYYSENGISQIGDLQATGVAVWDLGESVRGTNMTSAPIIVKELDELSESLKVLSIELTRFFADVDGDVDGILIVMDWAHRELSALTSITPTPLLDKISFLLTSLNLLPSPSSSTTTSQSYLAFLLPPSAALRTRLTLQRTFTEFLTVLEDAIAHELQSSLKIFALFEAVDRQFLNLARTVIRESDQQERLESELLSSLWTRVLGSNTANLRKYESNKKLLAGVRERTVRSKGILVEHNGKLMSLKANLEMLRRKLVGPLVRSNESSLSLESQLLGLEGVETHLRGVREVQKGRVMGILYGNHDRRRLGWGRDDAHEIEGGRDW